MFASGREFEKAWCQDCGRMTPYQSLREQGDSMGNKIGIWVCDECYDTDSDQYTKLPGIVAKEEGYGLEHIATFPVRDPGPVGFDPVGCLPEIGITLNDFQGGV
jgi:hypothetical protein